MTEHDLSPEQREELGDLSPLLMHLARYEIAEPDDERLLTMLTPLLHHEPQMVAVEELPKRGVQDWIRLAWAQTELLEAPFWGSSLLLTLIGILLATSYGSAAVTLCLLVISPLVAVAGVAYLFRPATRLLWELEQLSSVHPLEFLYARMALILTLNLTFAGLLLFAVWTQGLQIVLWRLMLIWFGPMIGLSGIALFCSVRWNMLAGTLAPMNVWMVLVVVGWRDAVLNVSPEIVNAGELIYRLGTSNLLSLMSGIVLFTGVVLLYASGRWVARWR